MKAIAIWIGIAIATLLYFFGKPAFPHEAPSGWSYPYQCCSGYDCREVDAPDTPQSERHHSVQVIRINGGYEISTTREPIMDNDPKIKDSPDGEFHWCSVGGKDDSKTICLFVPPPLF